MPPQLLDPANEPDDDVTITWADQSRINAFSKLNIRLQDIDDQLTALNEEKEYLDDLSQELELADEDEPVLYKMGECFFHLSLTSAQKRLEKDTATLDDKIDGLRKGKRECEEGMSELKVQLYARFGKSINLEM